MAFKNENIIFLGCTGILNNTLINTLKEEFNISAIVFESIPINKKINILKRRIKHIGIIKVIGQILFMFLHIFWIKKKSYPVVEKLLSNYPSFNVDCSNIEKIHVNDINDPRVLDLILKYKPKVIVVSGTTIIKKSLLEKASIPFIGIHTGITPLYRGVRGGFWATYENNLKYLGVTIQLINAGIDTGQIIYQGEIDFDPSLDNFDSIPAKQYIVAIRLMVKAVNDAFNNQLSTYTRNDLPSKLYYTPTILEYFLWLYKLRKLRA